MSGLIKADERFFVAGARGMATSPDFVRPSVSTGHRASASGHGHECASITLAPGLGDSGARRHRSAQPCVVRFKLFTLDEQLMLGALGRLATVDRQAVSERLQQLLPA